MIIQSAVLLCFLLCHAIAVPLLFEDSKVEKKDERSIEFCLVNSRVYKHGEMFTIGNRRCIKYRCEFGAHHILEEACESSSGLCYAVNSRFEENCMTYICVKTAIGSQYISYHLQYTGSRKCKDYYGGCRPPGEIFPYAINGTLYNNCVCRVSLKATHYKCSS